MITANTQEAWFYSVAEDYGYLEERLLREVKRIKVNTPMILPRRLAKIWNLDPQSSNRRPNTIFSKKSKVEN